MMDFIQCGVTKKVKENGDYVTKYCIHSTGINHVGACVFFKVVKLKW